MPQYLSAEWHDRARTLGQSLPERPGVSARLAYQVTGAPGGDIHYVQVVEDGRVVDQRLGAVDDADVTLVAGWADAVRIHRGELDTNVAFMQGKVKTGPGTDMRALMRLLPLTSSAEYRALAEQLGTDTQY